MYEGISKDDKQKIFLALDQGQSLQNATDALDRYLVGVNKTEIAALLKDLTTNGVSGKDFFDFLEQCKQSTHPDFLAGPFPGILAGIVIISSCVAGTLYCAEQCKPGQHNRHVRLQEDAQPAVELAKLEEGNKKPDHNDEERKHDEKEGKKEVPFAKPIAVAKPSKPKPGVEVPTATLVKATPAVEIKR